MRKLSLLVLLAGSLVQPLHAVTLLEKNTSIYKAQFDDGSSFELPRIKRYVKILKNPEGLEIINIEDVIVVENNNTYTIHGTVKAKKNKNINIKVPKEYKVVINDNSLCVYSQNESSDKATNIKNENKKVRSAIEWINDNDPVKFQKGFDILTEISQKESDSWAVHTAQGALGQLLLFTKSAHNEQDRLNDAYNLLTEAYKKTNNKRIQHIACACLGHLYMMNKNSLCEKLSNIEIAFNYFKEAHSKEYSPWAKHVSEAALAQIFMKEQILIDDLNKNEQQILNLLLSACQRTDSLRAQHFAEVALAKKLLIADTNDSEAKMARLEMAKILLTNASQKNTLPKMQEIANNMLSNNFALQSKNDHFEEIDVLETGNIQKNDDSMLIQDESIGDLTVKEKMSINFILDFDDRLVEKENTATPKTDQHMSFEYILN